LPAEDKNVKAILLRVYFRLALGDRFRTILQALKKARATGKPISLEHGAV